MTTFDLTPLYRNSIGFDRLASLLSTANRVDQGNGYPPYNIESRGENQYRITMAVAGFAEDDIEITVEENKLQVTGSKNNGSAGENQDNFLYRGIATRSFDRRFQLADYVKVNGATLENGLLHIDLEREVPEAMKPRTIEIGRANRALEGESEASKAA